MAVRWEVQRRRRRRRRPLGAGVVGLAIAIWGLIASAPLTAAFGGRLLQSPSAMKRPPRLHPGEETSQHDSLPTILATLYQPSPGTNMAVTWTTQGVVECGRPRACVPFSTSGISPPASKRGCDADGEQPSALTVMRPTTWVRGLWVWMMATGLGLGFSIDVTTTPTITSNLRIVQAASGLTDEQQLVAVSHNHLRRGMKRCIVMLRGGPDRASWGSVPVRMCGGEWISCI